MKPETLTRWEMEKAALRQRHEDLQNAHLRYMDASRRHRAEHPLTEEQIAAIRRRLRNGEGFLCCEKGRAFLKSIDLDECWVHFISSWFYEYEGCDHEMYGPKGRCYEKMLCDVNRLLNGEYNETHIEDYYR